MLSFENYPTGLEEKDKFYVSDWKDKHMVGCLMQKGTTLQTKVLDDLKLDNGEILKIQIRGKGHGCFWRGFRDLLEVGMICLDAEFKMQGFTKPKLLKIPNLVMHFEKWIRKWQKCNLQTKGFWSKEGMAYFYINGVYMT